MLWLYTAVSAALLFSAIAVLSKKIMSETSAVLFTSIYALLSALFYLPIFIYVSGSISVEQIVNLAPFIFLSGIANIVGILMYNYGIEKTDISVVMPLNRLQPVFVAIIGAIVLGEIITYSLGLGIILVTFGSYFVLLDDKKHLVEPFSNLEVDKGAQASVLSAIVFAVAAVNDRFITQQLSPEIYTFLLLTIMTFSINTYLYSKNRSHLKKVKIEILDKPKIYALTGLLSAGGYYSILTALSMAEASRVIPVMQIQIPLTVIAGGALFNEKHIIQKLIGSIILIIGIILVAI